VTKKEVAELFKLIKDFYPRFEVTQSKIDNWTRLMEGQNFDRVMFMTEQHIKKNKFPPTVSELVERIDETRNKDFSNQVEKWESEALGYCPYPTSDIIKLVKGK